MPQDYYADYLAHRKVILDRITAALAAERRAKPRRPKVDTPRKGSWADTVNTEPLPQLPSCPSPHLVGPLRNSVTIATLNAEEGHKLAMILNG